MRGRRLIPMGLRWTLALATATAALAQPLPGTRPLEIQGDPALEMVEGIHRYLDRATAEAADRRPAPDRERLRKIIGAVDARVAAPVMKLDANIGAILLLDEKTGEFTVEPRAVAGKAISIIPEKLPTTTRSLTAVVYRTNRPCLCNDTERDPNYYPIFQGVKSSLIVPISFQSRCIGVIVVESQERNRFTEADAEKLLSVARTATMFIRRAQLYRATAEHGDGIMIFGRNEKWREVERRIEKAAKTDATVILRGESGTGKELVAHAIHFNSPRRDGPFVVINCAAIPADLLESEMFGHVKGSFTGAYTDKTGEFERADGGTIFLDEIGDLPPILQVKLLRTLQSGEVRPVGRLRGAGLGRPAWSPHGRSLATTGVLEGRGSGLHLVDLDAEEPTLTVAGELSSAAWLPDGRSLAVTGRIGAASGLFLVDAAGGAARLLLAGGSSRSRPIVSADGRTILLLVGSRSRPRLVEVAIDGGPTGREVTLDHPREAGFWGIFEVLPRAGGGLFALSERYESDLGLLEPAG